MIERYLPSNDNRVFRIQISTKLSAFEVKETRSLAIALPKLVKVLSHRITWRSLGNVCGCLNDGKQHKLERRGKLGNVIVVIMPYKLVLKEC